MTGEEEIARALRQGADTIAKSVDGLTAEVSRCADLAEKLMELIAKSEEERR